MNDFRYKTAAYLRLSKGDNDVDGYEKDESNSISSQRLIIDRFLQENPEFNLYETYIDDGYTGTNFDRPGMQKMLSDVDKGLIDCIIVKDLSRFGRDRIATGNYIQKEFKEKGIRFIAINDSYDSLTAGNSERTLVLPIKTLTNDFNSMDTSAKIRASQSVKRAKGEFMAPYAPYGYIKDPEDKNHLLVDPEAAAVVRNIFAMKISGMSAYAIAKHLKENGVYTPGSYKETKIPGYENNTTHCEKANWSTKQVIRILENEVYLGSIVQGRKYKVNYKVNKIIYRPKEEWCIVPNMHEPIISKDDFDIVQRLMKRDTISASGKNECYLFSGLLFCGDCGKPMNRKVRRRKDSSYVEYLCKGYLKKTGCSSHKIQEEDLISAVKDSINNMISKLCDYDSVAKNLSEICVNKEAAIEQNKEIVKLKEEIERVQLLYDGLFRHAEEGLLNSEQVERFRERYSIQIEELKSAIDERKRLIEALYSRGLEAETLISRFRENQRIEELDRVLLVTTIDRILIHEEGIIEIVYRYADRIKIIDEIIESGITERSAS